jgi:hypothetical protein
MLQLSDGDGGLSDAVFETITVVLPNQPPIVHAGLDRTVPSGIAVFLQGDVEDETLPPPPLLETWWEAIDNPALVHFGDPKSPTTSVTFDQPGTYTLRLNATDQLLSAYDEVVMTAVCTSSAPQPQNANGTR